MLRREESHQQISQILLCNLWMDLSGGGSMSEKSWLCLALLILGILISGRAAHAASIDVIHYSATLEPDIAAKSVKGTVRIRFLTDSQEAEFNCGDLAVDSVRLAGAPLKFSVVDHRLRISLPLGSRASREIEIEFHGTPKRGIRFFPDRQQVYTVFSTSQWMVCVDDPADKATLTFKLILPEGLTPIANGALVSQRELPNNKRLSEWRQQTAIPTYIFGFAAGPFQLVKERRRNVELQYLATNYTASEVRRVFRDTPDMLVFFE